MPYMADNKLHGGKGFGSWMSRKEFLGEHRIADVTGNSGSISGRTEDGRSKGNVEMTRSKGRDMAATNRLHMSKEDVGDWMRSSRDTLWHAQNSESAHR